MIRYYACAHRFAYDETNGIPKCTNPSIREDKLDELLNSKLYYENRLDGVQEIEVAGEWCIEALEKAIVTDNDKIVEQLDSEIQTLTEQKGRLLTLFAEEIYSKEQLEDATNDYNKRIKELTLKRSQLAKGNDELRADIKRIKELVSSAYDEEKAIVTALNTGKFPKRTRREQLKDVDYISIDIFGNPSIVFKSLNEIQKTVAYLDSVRHTYEANITDSEDDTPKKTLAEVMKEAKENGISIKYGKQ
jgi:septal ring factor EnvC (AmiA/AmiB activator)